MNGKVYNVLIRLSEDDVMEETKRFEMTVKLSTLALLRERYGDQPDQDLLRLAAGELLDHDASLSPSRGYESELSDDEKRELWQRYAKSDRTAADRERLMAAYGIRSEQTFYKYARQVKSGEI